MTEDMDCVLESPSDVGRISPENLYEFLQEQNYSVSPLSRGDNEGIPFLDGGGFKILWRGDRILSYNPTGFHHGDIPYYKVSSGQTGIIRIKMGGEIF